MKNIRILFVTFYGLIDYVADIFNQFYLLSEDEDNTLDKVFEFPFLKYQNDEKLKSDEMVEKIIENVKKEEITHIFWFFLPDLENVIPDIKNQVPYLKYIFYNFDDPKSFNVVLHCQNNKFTILLACKKSENASMEKSLKINQK